MKFNFWTAKPTTSPRCVLLGPDTSGKTTLLYMWKMAQVVQTFPTVGFSFEKMDLSGHKLDVVDFGGCDKLAPLARHYIDSATGLLFLHPMPWEGEGLELSKELLRLHVGQLIDAKGKHVWIMLTKQDLIPAEELDQKRREVYQVFKKVIQQAELDFEGKVQWKVFDRPGLNVLDFMLVKPIYEEIATTLNEQTERPQPLPARKTYSKCELRAKIGRESFEDDQPDKFWQGFLAADLPQWNHRSHLRAGFMTLLKSAAALENFWTAVNTFIEHIERLRNIRPDRFRNTTHRTMTTFWLYVLQLAVATFRNNRVEQRLPRDDEFVEVLLTYPQLADSSYWEDFYSKGVMYSGEARQNWCLPDKNALPTVFKISSSRKKAVSKTVTGKEEPEDGSKINISGDDGQARLVRFALSVVQDYLTTGQRRGKIIAHALPKLQRLTIQQRASEGSESVPTYSETQAYFWIQIVHATLQPLYHSTSTPESTSIHTSSSRSKSVRALTYVQFMHIFRVDLHCWKNYYSPSLWNSVKARTAFINPDLRPLPNVLAGPTADVLAARVFDIQTTLIAAKTNENQSEIDRAIPTAERSPEETALRIDAIVAEVECRSNARVISKDDISGTGGIFSIPTQPRTHFDRHVTLLSILHTLLQHNVDHVTGAVDVSSFVAGLLSSSSTHNKSVIRTPAGSLGSFSTDKNADPAESLFSLSLEDKSTIDNAHLTNTTKSTPTSSGLDMGVTKLLFYAQMTLALSRTLKRDPVTISNGTSDTKSSSLAISAADSFRDFLTARPALLWEDLPFLYYRPETWNSLDAKVMMVAPDLKTLPIG